MLHAIVDSLMARVAALEARLAKLEAQATQEPPKKPKKP